MSKEIIRIVLYGLGLGSLSAIVYLAGPLIAFGDMRPLENPIVRDILILLLVAGAGSLAGVKIWRRRKGADQVAESLSGAEPDHSDADVLKGRMNDALATLKNARGGKASYLYDLPWYVLIGRPGSGKTTALVNSGLKFPLAGGGRPAVVAGVGGTRYCDWWFTEEAVLIDTAGRYTTHESDPQADQKSWFAFLDTLKRGRPKQPINGVLVAISIEDILTLSATDLAALAAAMRARLLELHTRLKVDFPVYALFTKMDLVLGFNEFFQNLGQTGRAQVFGATFQTSDKTSNLVGQVPAEFDALVESLNEEMLDRLQDEPAPATRVQLYGFPTQMEALKRPLFDFLNQIFEPTRYHANATLRGFYFTSGTQEGTPIDQLIGALEKSFGTVEIAASSYSGEGKSFFLTDLINKVIIGEAAWVSTDRAAVRRAAILKACAYAAMILVGFGLVGLWWISYGRNATLISDVKSAVADYTANDNGVSQQTTIASHDLSKVLPQLGRLRALPDGYAERTEAVPLAETFGLSQHDRLQSSAITSYHVALERMFRPRLIFRLEEVLDAKRTDPGVIYPALKVYKMLGGLHKTDPALVLDWMRRDWADNLYLGEGNEPGRKALEEHLQAMLDLDEGDKPLVSLSRPLLEDSEASLAQLSVAQRAYELLKSQASPSAKQPDWSLVRQGGSQLATVFEAAGPEPLATIHVPYFYTYDGFHRALLGRFAEIASQIDAERWVLGESAKQSSLAEQYKTLPQDLLAIYTRDFIASWQQMLRKIRLKRFATDKTYVALTAAASPTSPIRQLIEGIRDQTAVTRPPPKPADASAETKPAVESSGLLQDGAPGAAIEDAFKGFQDMLSGDAGTRPIDQLLKTLGNIANDLKRQASNPSDRPQTNADLQLQIAALRNLGPSLPVPFSDMIQGAAAEFDSEEVRTAIGLLAQELDQVADTCRAATDNRYPFVKASDRDIGLVDFGRVFGPGGELDSFFTRNLAKFAQKSGRGWVWRPGDPVARALSPSLLKSFTDASQIRDAYFGSGSAQPSFMVTVTPPAITDPSVTAKIDFYGTPITALAGNSAPTAASWPGPGTYQIKITLSTASTPAADAPATTQTATPPEVSTLVNKTGVWSLFRLLDDAGRGGTSVSFFSGGQTYKFQFAAASAVNPLNLAMVRQFQCPARI
ncbi:type VI secretion system membrane subunit TssM [Lichenifustis flavocetrariae]|uniref:Type VI secretion system membrane subunit TssM n=1 Tax=Lichenifustis flavocetrariae TaxID=2949735 RepID=A0AA42CGZ1_9HYPH|nr:type VI secretion system membrane subunit TssM [Lichenifustis flavocetrariae]MCW6506724.1 type VI secretion system membrane subunit TssM [Lichenifustis flavocetrariae]